ncbi:spore germination protein [Bacillus shivajii]|uniref:spore germination protein n=1 Tax=Bacillus shivajii TaxID=1983719 RepID=UPI001CF97FF1|nr:spore germination protein [Bacillus shivajii]UCZ52112.1 spore germination protein [Bacillus shivajii]
MSQTKETQENISRNITDSEKKISDTFDDCKDIKIQEYHYGYNLTQKAMTVHCSSLVQDQDENHLKRVLQDLVTHELGQADMISVGDIKSFFQKHGVSYYEANLLSSYDEVIDDVLSGHVVILFDQWDEALSFEAISVESRGVDEPVSESVVKGPHDGMVENLQTNLGLLRSRLRNPKFKIKSMTSGKSTKTEIAYGYLEGAVDPETLEEFEKRLEQLEDVEILETSYIEELIEDSTYSPFPQYRYTERPDVAVSALLDGKILVLVHGTGTAMICPALYLELFQSPEDYYQRTVISSMIRILRFIAVIIAVTLPSVYISLSTFHPEMIPSQLLLAVLDTREGIPFPAIIEALIMMFFFELMREAGIRLPKPVGEAVSIVGALIIGEAAIEAGIASPIMVVVVALTGVSTFTIPSYNLGISYRILQYPLMFLSASLGAYGLAIGLLLIILHLTCLRSLGQPYLSPVAPARPFQWREVFVRIPLKTLLRSPRNKHMHRVPKN